MNKLLIICGPTASGKTALALDFAKKFSAKGGPASGWNGELISADSRQVYLGMNIVTGKETDKKVKTWLLDVVNPDYNFNISDYYNLAWEAVFDIWKRRKLPIVVGGTGFYIKAMIDEIGTMGVLPNIELRQELSVLSVELLGQKLAKLDPERWEKMNGSDRKNPRRLIRAIEIHLGGVQPATPEVVLRLRRTSGVNLLWIGLTTEKKILYEKINRRVEERLKMGAVEETRKLARRYGWNVPSMTGIGYRQLRQYIEGKISLDEAVERWKLAEHAYAQKQMTWFRKEKRIVWLNVEEKVKQWYTVS